MKGDRERSLQTGGADCMASRSTQDGLLSALHIWLHGWAGAMQRNS